MTTEKRPKAAVAVARTENWNLGSLSFWVFWVPHSGFATIVIADIATAAAASRSAAKRCTRGPKARSSYKTGHHQSVARFIRSIIVRVHHQARGPGIGSGFLPQLALLSFFTFQEVQGRYPPRGPSCGIRTLYLSSGGMDDDDDDNLPPGFRTSRQLALPDHYSPITDTQSPGTLQIPAHPTTPAALTPPLSTSHNREVMSPSSPAPAWPPAATHPFSPFATNLTTPFGATLTQATRIDIPVHVLEQFR